MVHGRPSVQQAVKVAISPYSVSVCLSDHLQVDNVVVGMDVFLFVQGKLFIFISLIHMKT